MAKVICINKNGWVVKKKFLLISWNQSSTGPSYEEICEVIEVQCHKEGMYYTLAEYGTEDEYASSQFVPFVELSETTSESLLADEKEKVNA